MRVRIVAALLALVALGSGCTPYSVRTADMRAQLDADDIPRALDALDARLGGSASSSSSSAKGLDGDRALLLLERATLLAEVGRLQESAEAFGIADKRLDVGDMVGAGRDHRSRGFGIDTTGCIQGSASCPYRTIPAEKLMVNAMGTLVYLAMHRADQAAIEGRRIDVSRRFLDDRDVLPRNVLSLASFLAAIAFEKNGNDAEAKSSRQDVPVAGDEDTAGEDVVIVVGHGRGPYKTAALVSVRSLASRLESAGQRELAEQSKQLVWTSPLVETPSALPVALQLDDRPLAPAFTWDIASEAAAEWQALDDARLTSRVTPILDCESARSSGPCGFTADTRNWETLPARFLAARVHVGAGAHRLVVMQGEKRRVIEWTSRGDGWRVVPAFFRGQGTH
jgi:hypothetical protein